mgnify:CR=1 FL=1
MKRRIERELDGIVEVAVAFGWTEDRWTEELADCAVEADPLAVKQLPHRFRTYERALRSIARWGVTLRLIWDTDLLPHRSHADPADYQRPHALAALTRSHAAWEYVAPELRDDRAFLLAALRANPQVRYEIDPDRIQAARQRLLGPGGYRGAGIGVV